MLVWAIIAVVAGAMAITLAIRMHHWSAGTTRLKGAVIIRDDDTRKELPIADVAVTASDGATSATTPSNASGYFDLPFKGGIWPGQTVTLSFRHPDYEPLDIKLQSSLRLSAKQLWVIRMVPTHEHSGAGLSKPPVVMSNIRVRYTVNSQTEVNIGSAVKTFQVVNQANVPCVRGSPCSRMEVGRPPPAQNRWTQAPAMNSKMFALRALRAMPLYSNRYQWLCERWP